MNRIRSHSIIVFCMLCLLPIGAAWRSAAAETLAVFECVERTGRDWHQTMVTYAVEFETGHATPGTVRLVDARGDEILFQFWRVKNHADGSIASARLSFYAELPKNGSYRFELQRGKPTAGIPADVKTDAGLLTLDNGLTAIRLPAGERQFQPPLAMASGQMPVPESCQAMEQAGIAFGPVAGVLLRDGRWTGGSYFATEPIEAVRLRQGYFRREPTAAETNAAAQAAPKVVGYKTEIVEHGPLFTDARIHFDLDNGGYYQLTARVLADDPAIRIDEMMDVRGNCPPDHPLYVDFVLNSGWQEDGWRPDAIFMFSRRRTERHEPLEEILEQHNFAPQYASLPLDYDTDNERITDVVPWDPWHAAAQYFGIVNMSQLRQSKSAPFLAVVPQHTGSWRAAHWVFPPKNPHMFQQLISWKNGIVAMRWTIRAQPHPQNLLQTGEFDTELGLTAVRRLWCLVAGPFQYHDTLLPLRAQEGFVNLDNYKDWNLAWCEETQQAAELPVPDSALQQQGPLWQLNMAFRGGDDGTSWVSHYRQSQSTGWASTTRRSLDDETLPAAQRGQLKASVAAFCYMMAEPDFNTRASMTHQGNPNMPINRFLALPFAAVLIPDHPMANTWMDVSAQYVRYKLGTNTAPGGAWSELITYYGASAPTLIRGARTAGETGRLDEKTARLAVMPAAFTMKLLTPVDPRFNRRVVPGFGHEGNMTSSQWSDAAGVIQDIDPDLAAMFAWTWQEQGRPNNWPEAGNLLQKATPQLISSTLTSTWIPGMGAVLRAHGGNTNETYMAYRQGYLASHSDPNQGDFIIYAKGAPLTTMSIYGYPTHQRQPYIDMYNQFGWHSRVRFGSQSDYGGWPGGGPVSGVHRHFFSPSVDYIRGIGDYSSKYLKPGDPIFRDLTAPDALRWTRQILFLKGRQPTSPSYFVFRDSFRSLHGTQENLPQTWWYQRTLGNKDQVTATPAGFDYASAWGPQMNVRFLQPAQVVLESREVSSGDETLTINAAGPIGAGQDALVMIHPRGREEAPARYESLGDGIAKIITTESTDYVFASVDGMTYLQGDIAFEGIAGAVRVFEDEVHLIVAEGEGAVSYRGFPLRAGQPATRVVPMNEVERRGTIDVPAPETTISFALDEKQGAIEQIATGVRRQNLPDGFAIEFNAPDTLDFEREGVVFTGKRGAMIVDTELHTVRMVMLDGEKIGYNGLLADVATGPYDLTFHSDRIEGLTEGPARFIHLTMPDGLRQLPCITIDGISYAPGTDQNTVIVPVNEGRFEFTVEDLAQPAIFKSWQRW